MSTEILPGSAAALTHNPAEVLDRFAMRLKESGPSVSLLNEIQQAALVHGALRVVLWMSADGPSKWRVGQYQPMDVDFLQQQRDDLRVHVNAASQAPQASVLNLPNSAILLCPMRAGAVTLAVLSGEFPATEANSEVASRGDMQFLLAASELIGEILVRFECERLRLAEAKLNRERLATSQPSAASVSASPIHDEAVTRLAHRIWGSSTLAEAASISVSDMRAIVGCDRVSVLALRGLDFKLLAVSGAEHLDQRSGTCRSLASVATVAAASPTPLWHDLVNAATSDSNTLLKQPVTSKTDAAVESLLAAHQRETGAVRVGVIPVHEPGAATLTTTSTTSSSARCMPAQIVIVVENLRLCADLGVIEKQTLQANALVAHLAGPLHAARLRSLLPWWRRVTSGQHLTHSLKRTTPLLAAGGITLASLVLWLVPAELTIRAEGELWPANRRNIFASSAGIVSEILVQQGENVSANAPVIRLRDSELDLEEQRITGELAMAREKLRVLQASRLVGATNPMQSATRMSGDEEEIKEQVAGLEQQQRLTTERQVALTHLSPMAGTLLTWDPVQRLAGRPVERGQLLLTVGETDGPWAVEYRVSDRDIGHLLQAGQQQGDSSPVSATTTFLLALAPERSHTGRVERISRQTETDTNGQGFVRVVASVAADQLVNPRAGSTVIGHLNCGRASLGYVWFHKLIDALRTW